MKARAQTAATSIETPGGKLNSRSVFSIHCHATFSLVVYLLLADPGIKPKL